jgi:peptidoglycan/LPS O-acetylase OafA/YrhL
MLLKNTDTMSTTRSNLDARSDADTAARAVDPLLGPQHSMPDVPLLRDEHPPVVKLSLLDVSPVARRMENLDALRILCLSAIILTHVTEAYLTEAMHRKEMLGAAGMVILSLNVMGRFGVSCFLMISFFIYWHQLYDKGRSWGELMARRFKRLIPAFLCWSSFYFLLHKELFQGLTIHHHQLWPSFGHAFYTQAEAFRYSLGNWRTWVHVYVYGQGEYHLYYLPLVMQCLLLIPLLKLLWRSPVVSWGWVVLTSAAWVVMVYGPVFFPHGSMGWKISTRLFSFMNQPWAVPFLIFPLFGMMCAGQKQFRQFLVKSSTGFWVALLVFGLVLHAMEANWLFRVLPMGKDDSLLRAASLVKLGRILSSFAVFALFMRQPMMRDPFPKVSHHAFGIHFMHPAIIIALTLVELRFFGPQVAHFQSWAPLTLAINFVLAFWITFGLCLVVSRSKRLEFLVV